MLQERLETEQHWRPGSAFSLPLPYSLSLCGWLAVFCSCNAPAGHHRASILQTPGKNLDPAELSITSEEWILLRLNHTLPLSMPNKSCSISENTKSKFNLLLHTSLLQTLQDNYHVPLKHSLSKTSSGPGLLKARRHTKLVIIKCSLPN